MNVLTVQADVDLDEVLEEVSTGDLVRALSSRGREAVLDALTMLKTGRIEDGIAALEREFFPRYSDEAECRAAYLRAVGLDEARRAAA